MGNREIIESCLDVDTNSTQRLQLGNVPSTPVLELEVKIGASIEMKVILAIL